MIGRPIGSTPRQSRTTPACCPDATTNFFIIHSWESVFRPAFESSSLSLSLLFPEDYTRWFNKVLKVLGWVGIYSLQNERKKTKKTFPVASRAPTSKKRSNELELGARKVLYIGPDVIPMQISNAALVYSIAPFYNNLFRRLAARRPVMSAAPGIEIPRGNEHFLFFLKKQNKTKKYTFSKGREIIHHSCASCVLLSLYGRGGVSTYSAVISLSLSLFFLISMSSRGTGNIDWLESSKNEIGRNSNIFQRGNGEKKKNVKVYI